MTGRVVVGVDGSPAALAALTWAAGEARLRGAELVVWTVADRTGADVVTAPVSRPRSTSAPAGIR
jgi:nucleotide-binding universal stress UspA family protein